LSEDLRACTSECMTEEQKVESIRLAAMRKIVGSLIDSEEQRKRGLMWKEIIALTDLGDSSARRAIEDLVALKYVVCTTVSGIEETSGAVQIKKLCELYGTTFFGRKWLAEP
jgi:hypothetical protein